LNLTDKSKHCRIELLRFLQGSEMAHAVQYDECSVRDAPREIFGMFTLDEFVMLVQPFAFLPKRPYASRAELIFRRSV